MFYVVKQISNDEIYGKMDYIRKNFELSQKQLETKLHWQKVDSRMVLFVKGIRLMNALQMGFRHRMKDLTDPKWWERNYPPQEFDKENLKLLIIEFDTLLRVSFIENMYAITDSSIRLIASGYNPAKFPDLTSDFSNIYSKLLKLLKLESYIPLLQIFSILRNSLLHNDGLFFPRLDKDRQISYNGKTYNFVVGTYVDSSWGTILDLMFYLGKMNYDIVTRKEISAFEKMVEPASKFWVKD